MMMVVAMVVEMVVTSTTPVARLRLLSRTWPSARTATANAHAVALPSGHSSTVPERSCRRCYWCYWCRRCDGRGDRDTDDGSGQRPAPGSPEPPPRTSRSRNSNTHGVARSTTPPVRVHCVVETRARSSLRSLLQFTIFVGSVLPTVAESSGEWESQFSCRHCVVLRHTTVPTLRYPHAGRQPAVPYSACKRGFNETVLSPGTRFLCRKTQTPRARGARLGLGLGLGLATGPPRCPRPRPLPKPPKPRGLRQLGRSRSRATTATTATTAIATTATIPSTTRAYTRTVLRSSLVR